MGFIHSSLILVLFNSKGEIIFLKGLLAIKLTLFLFPNHTSASTRLFWLLNKDNKVVFNATRSVSEVVEAQTTITWWALHLTTPRSLNIFWTMISLSVSKKPIFIKSCSNTRLMMTISNFSLTSIWSSWFKREFKLNSGSIPAKWKSFIEHSGCL